MMRRTVFVSATPAGYEHQHQAQVVEQVVRPTGLVDPHLEVRPASTQVDDLLSEINERIARQERVLVTTLTKRMAKTLRRGGRYDMSSLLTFPSGRTFRRASATPESRLFDLTMFHVEHLTTTEPWRIISCSR